MRNNENILRFLLVCFYLVKRKEGKKGGMEGEKGKRGNGEGRKEEKEGGRMNVW